MRRFAYVLLLASTASHAFLAGARKLAEGQDCPEDWDGRSWSTTSGGHRGLTCTGDQQSGGKNSLGDRDTASCLSMCRIRRASNLEYPFCCVHQWRPTGSGSCYYSYGPDARTTNSGLITYGAMCNLDCSTVPVTGGTCLACSAADRCTSVRCDPGFSSSNGNCVDTNGCTGNPCTGPGAQCADAAAADFVANGVAFTCVCAAGHGMVGGSTTQCEVCTGSKTSLGEDATPCMDHQPCEVGEGVINEGTSTTHPTCAPCTDPWYSASSSYDICYDAGAHVGIVWTSSGSVACALGFVGEPVYSDEGGYASGCIVDIDSDGDGVQDVFEQDDDGSARDSDGDGLADHLDDDDDNDGVPTNAEASEFALSCPSCVALPGDDGRQDTDQDGIADFLDPDDDNDGIPTLAEAGDFAAFCPACSLVPGPGGRQDSDGDSMPDYLDNDDDSDGIRTNIEASSPV